ncbi:hypothetical protein Tco_0313734 [Tanacetum coccineum]
MRGDVRWEREWELRPRRERGRLLARLKEDERAREREKLRERQEGEGREEKEDEGWRDMKGERGSLEFDIEILSKEGERGRDREGERGREKEREGGRDMKGERERERERGRVEFKKISLTGFRSCTSHSRYRIVSKQTTRVTTGENLGGQLSHVQRLKSTCRRDARSSSDSTSRILDRLNSRSRTRSSSTVSIGTIRDEGIVRTTARDFRQRIHKT